MVSFLDSWTRLGNWDIWVPCPVAAHSLDFWIIGSLAPWTRLGNKWTRWGNKHEATEDLGPVPRGRPIGPESSNGLPPRLLHQAPNFPKHHNSPQVVSNWVKSIERKSRDKMALPNTNNLGHHHQREGCKITTIINGCSDEKTTPIS